MKACLTASGELASAIGLPVVPVRKVGVNAILPYDVVIFNGTNLFPVNYYEGIIDNVVLLSKLIDVIGDRKLIYISSMSSGMSNPYGISKKIGEVLAETTINHAIVRFSTLFYEDFNRDGLSKLIRDAVCDKAVTLIGDGAAKRDFIPLAEVGYYIKSNITDICGELILASGESNSFLDLATKICLETDSILSFKEGLESLVPYEFKKTVDCLNPLDFYIRRYINKLRGSLCL